MQTITLTIPDAPAWAAHVEEWDFDSDGSRSRFCRRRLHDAAELSVMQVVTTDGAVRTEFGLDLAGPVESDHAGRVVAEMRALALALLDGAQLLEGADQ